jgi:hypothetical protein
LALELDVEASPGTGIMVIRFVGPLGQISRSGSKGSNTTTGSSLCERIFARPTLALFGMSDMSLSAPDKGQVRHRNMLQRKRNIPSKRSGCPCRLTIKIYPNLAEVLGMYDNEHSHSTGLQNLKFTRLSKLAKISWTI